MRARVLHPGFFKNEQLVGCSPRARLLFAGLWCLADREGRLEDRPARIKMELFPSDKVDMDALLQELMNAGLIVQYVVADRKYLAIPGFSRWQRPHPREAASILPAPDGVIATIVPLHGEPGNSTASPSVYGIGSPRTIRSPETNTKPVEQVWQAWLESTKRTACKLDDKRRKVIAARLADYPVEDVLDAVRGWERDPWPDRRRQNGLEILLRDAAHVEKFRDMWRNPSNASTTSTPDLGEHYTGPTPLARQYW